MFALCRPAAMMAGTVGVCLFAACPTRTAHAQGNVPIAFDALMVINRGATAMGQSGWGGYNGFTFSNTVTPYSADGLGRYDAFELFEPGSGGSGIGINFGAGRPDNPVNAGSVVNPVTPDLFPIIDRSMFGANFDPSQYRAELVFKPLTMNTATNLNMTLDTFDGFDASGARRASQWQWHFFNLASPDPSTDPLMSGPDADGFYTVINGDGPDADTQGGSLVAGNSFYGGSAAPSFMFTQQPLPGTGDADPDFNDFEAFEPGGLAVPNGVYQISLQTAFGDPAALVDHFAIKSLRIVKINPDPEEVARLDARSGLSQRFGSPFRRDDTDPPIVINSTDYFPTDFGATHSNTDMVSRFDENGFTNIVIKTDDDLELGGIALFQPPSTQTFDGTNATVDITARLTVPQGAGQADRIVLVLKDKDGNDTGPGLGGEEYQYQLMLNEFNTASMTTVSVPLTDFTAVQGFEFVNTGDGSLSDFNLYHLGIQTVPGIGLVNLEVESVRVLAPVVGLTGDYNGDGKVDAADYVVWRKNPASFGGQQGYDDWRANFGAMAGGGASVSTAGIPEPAAWLLTLMAVSLALTVGRRR